VPENLGLIRDFDTVNVGYAWTSDEAKKWALLVNICRMSTRC
jgi:hypothetical protein